MKKLVLVGLISTLLIGCAVPSSHDKQMAKLKSKLAEIDKKYDEKALKGNFYEKIDKFSGHKEIKWEVGIADSQRYNRVTPKSFSSVLGKKNSVVITTQSKSPIKCDITQWLVDGKKFVLKPSSSGVTPGLYGSFVQVIIYNPSNAQMKKLSMANSVDVKICNDEYTFSHYELDALKEVVKRAEL